MTTLTRGNRQHRIVDIVLLDKGKRHYWGGPNGDYGFVQSPDLKQLKYQRLNHSQSHRNSEPFNEKKGGNQYSSREGYLLYHDVVQQQISRKEQKKKKLQINDTIQISLPPIQKRKSVLYKPQQIVKTPYTNVNLKSAIPEYQRSQPRKQREDYQKRVKTQISHYQDIDQFYTNQRVASYRGNKVRYTPTFICSLGNPMPSYKLYPNQQNY